MRLGIVHLSDIHFRAGKNPVINRVDAMVAAINSVDPSIGTYLIAISGDIAFSGIAEEYVIAQKFFAEIRERLLHSRDKLKVLFVCVPGNHDCYLPTDQIAVRQALIQGVSASMSETKQDPALMTALLAAQSAYDEFQRHINEEAQTGIEFVGKLS